MTIRKYELFRGANISGPTAVFLGLIFSDKGNITPLLVPLPKASGDEKLLDVEALVAEVREGVDRANQEFNSNLKIHEIQYVPNDYPSKSQVAYLAYKIARTALGK